MLNSRFDLVPFHVLLKFDVPCIALIRLRVIYHHCPITTQEPFKSQHLITYSPIPPCLHRFSPSLRLPAPHPLTTLPNIPPVSSSTTRTQNIVHNFVSQAYRTQLGSAQPDRVKQGKAPVLTRNNSVVPTRLVDASSTHASSLYFAVCVTGQRGAMLQRRWH